MAFEKNVPIDLDTLTLPAIYSNRAQVTGSPPVIRIAFGEGIGGQNIHYRVAVVLNVNDAREVAEAIMNIVNQMEAPAVAVEPSPKASA